MLRKLRKTEKKWKIYISGVKNEIAIKKISENLDDLGNMDDFPHQAKVILNRLKKNTVILYSYQDSYYKINKAMQLIYQDCLRIRLFLCLLDKHRQSSFTNFGK